jgi:F-type H+-transporting ATPase subunit epsilon
MHLEIITPDSKVFEGEASSVQFPGTDGLFEVLDNHAAMISALGQGEVRIRSTGREQRISIAGGIVEIMKNRVVVLAEKVLVR